MSTALVQSRAQLGLNAPKVSVEVHLPNGLPAFVSTGVSGNELRDRVKSAIQNSAFDFPDGRIVVNLGPAELPKSGGRYDLAIAAGILVASEQLPATALTNFDLLGELSLFGDVRPVRGALTAARETLAAHRKLICAHENGAEFGKSQANCVWLISHLNELANLPQLPRVVKFKPAAPAAITDPLQAVVGQDRSKRALTIAAAGGHHMLMTGPPGAGKTMLAERLRDLLPPLDAKRQVEVAEIYSLSGLKSPAPGKAPFRAPHHSASCAALTGGGSPPMPGEVSHAHNGVLFMDEMPEFRRDLIEALREPLEGGRIRLNRRGFAVDYPARFQLVAAMNPCPVGRVCKPLNCRCPPEQAQRYRNRISAPILDRIDLHIEVEAVAVADLLRHSQTTKHNETLSQSTLGHQRMKLIKHARTLQSTRSDCLNAHLNSQQTETFCACSDGVTTLLSQAAERLELSARGYFRALRVARTITDLDMLAAERPIETLISSPITEKAVAEALSYRALAGDSSV